MNKRHLWSSFTLILLLALAACGPAASPTAAPTTAATPTPTSVTTLAPTTAPTPTPTTAPTLAPTSGPTAVATATPASAFPLTITDSNNRKVTIASQPQKIVCLAPSDTEIVYALGQGSRLVAVDQFSDYPPEAKSVLNIGGSRGNFDLEKIVALHPDLVLAAGTTSTDNLKKLEDLKLTIVVVSSSKTTMDSIISDIKLIGAVLGVPGQAGQVTDAMQFRLDNLKLKVAAAKSRPRVYWELDATDPAKPFTVGAGNFVNDLIKLAGGENVFGAVTSPFPQVGAESVVAAAPEVILLSDAAYGISPESVKARSGWSGVPAVKTNKVFPIEDSLVSRPGPRIVDGLEAATHIIHPELFQ
jgi:iron complex transport system substrate-binding protein